MRKYYGHVATLMNRINAWQTHPIPNELSRDELATQSLQRLVDLGLVDVSDASTPNPLYRISDRFTNPQQAPPKA